ncbi:MAG TPA: HAD-IC family P-type ATPase, partial [Methanotrichaceae archaeon]|nr:HAD-IC family P-type ATPase [Methanotrichaceae archaeon]
METEELFVRLGTDERGLSTEEAKKRIQEHGLNELLEGKKTSKIELLIDQLKNPLIAVLAAAGVISFLADKSADAVFIFVVIVIDVSIGFIQEFRAEEAISALRSISAPEAMVMRDCPESGQCQYSHVKARDLVPGDIILMEAGSKVPADCRIIEEASLEIDESMLTGESVPSRKNTDVNLTGKSPVEMSNVAFAGTSVVRGRGKAVVFYTGMDTEMGKIARLITKTEKAETPLKRRTIDLSKKLMFLAIFASALTLALGMLRGFDLIELFLFTLAMAVSAIPEGLPVAITVVLALGVSQMAKRHAIIRRLSAVDALGSVTVICTDKTGTLTTNQMTVQKIFVWNRMVEVAGSGFKPEGYFEIDGARVDPGTDEALKTLLKASALCNDASLSMSGDGDEKRWTILGDPTEGALIIASEKAGLHKGELEAEFPRIDEIPFDPQSRYMATFHKAPEGSVDVFLKGAPEVVVSMCSQVLEDREIVPMEPEKKEKILEAASQMAGQALRVLAVAYRTLEMGEIKDFKANPGKSIFVGLLGMMDPPRAEAIDGVRLAKRAGIKVIMATGDHKITAKAIAREIGILEEGLMTLTGPDLDKLSDAELDDIIQSCAVFARVSPEHKHRVVESLRRIGHITAMTGDGINDAPALKAAEVGIAMGITGTDVTKETADMILTDDNFRSIINAVEEGRVVFENIRKVAKYLISTNAGAILIILASMILLSADVLIWTPVQILWVNLVTDGVLVVNLAMEPKEDDVMNKPPRRPKDDIINRDILYNVIFVSIFMAAGTLWVFTRYLDDAGLAHART